MPGHLHDMLLRDACQGHVARGRASEVVEVVIADSGSDKGLLSGSPKVPNGPTVSMKDPGSVWMPGTLAPRDDLGEFPRETQHLHVFMFDRGARQPDDPGVHVGPDQAENLPAPPARQICKAHDI